MAERPDTRTARQISRGRTRKAGDRSAKLANQLMKLAAPALKKLEIDDELREAVHGARAVTSHVARRRAERTLAGELRRHDLVALAEQLAKVGQDDTDVAQFHLAEQWRARLIEEGTAALAGFPVATDDSWPRLIEAARRERDTGRPPGAARTLFRAIMTAFKDAAAASDPPESDGEPDGEPGDEPDDDLDDADDDVAAE